MKPGILLCVLCCAASSVVAQSPLQAPYDVWAAAVDRNKEGELYSKCTATEMAIDRFMLGAGGHPDVAHFHVAVSKTAGEIGRLFAEARRLYKPTKREAVPRELHTDAVYVVADPHQPPAGNTMPPPIEHIVLKSKTSGAAIQPAAFKVTPVEWASGGVNPPNRASARFELGPVRELPAGDFDVVLITTAGERRCKVGAKDRQRLFGGR